MLRPDYKSRSFFLLTNRVVSPTSCVSALWSTNASDNGDTTKTWVDGKWASTPPRPLPPPRQGKGKPRCTLTLLEPQHRQSFLHSANRSQLKPTQEMCSVAYTPSAGGLCFGSESRNEMYIRAVKQRQVGLSDTYPQHFTLTVCDLIGSYHPSKKWASDACIMHISRIIISYITTV